MTDERPFQHPCPACPWRTANHGKRHPSGWYTKANLRRLWAGMRTGESMSCHPTDPNNPVTEHDQAAGYRPAPAHSRTLECAGAEVLKQREWMVLQEVYGGDAARYLRERRRGLTRHALWAVAMRAMTRGALSDGPPPHVDLGEPVDVPELPRLWPPASVAA